MNAAPRAEPETPAVDGDLVVLGRVAIVVLLLASLAVSFAAVRYFRLTAIDDYRTGYSVGVATAGEGERTDLCGTAEERLYGESGQGLEPGWAQFRAGCRDGLTGEPPASWYQMRWAPGGADGGFGLD